MDLKDAELEKLFEEYKPLVLSKAGLYYMLGADRDDLIQEGMIGLFNAVKTYDESKGASLRTYADVCISRQMLAALRAASRKKNSPLSDYVSLDARLESGKTLAETLTDPAAGRPESSVVFESLLSELLSPENRLLSKLEKEILGGLIGGKDYREIAGDLGKSPKSVDNGIQRIRTKLKGYFNE
jgi:RNA polymerase sporulation-specific sigma factor